MGEVICLSSLVGLEDVRGMVQVALGQPEVILWAIALEPDHVFWLSILTYQLVGENIFYLKLFLTLHQLEWWSLMRGSHLWGPLS